MAGNDKHCQLLSTKENGMFGSLGGTLGASPPKCEMQCTGQTSILVQNFNQIRSAVSEEIHPEQTETNVQQFRKRSILNRQRQTSYPPVTTGETTEQTGINTSFNSVSM